MLRISLLTFSQMGLWYAFSLRVGHFIVDPNLKSLDISAICRMEQQPSHYHHPSPWVSSLDW